MPATKTHEPLNDRLTMRWWPAFSPTHRAELEVTERKSSVRSESTTYAVSEDTPLPSGKRVFRVRKQGMQPTDWYEVHVAADGSAATACTCPCAVYRKNQLECRHRLAVLHLLAEGVF
jgi:hypothetical protein